MRQNRKQDTVKTGRRSSVWSCSVHPLDTYVNFGVDVGVFTRFETGIIYPFRNTHRQKTSMLFFSRSVVCNSLWPHGRQHARLLCLSLSPRVYSDSCPLGRWCHPTISSSVAPFSSCLQFFPASGSFLRSLLCFSGQIIRTSASASVLPVNIQGWVPLNLYNMPHQGLIHIRYNRCYLNYSK